MHQAASRPQAIFILPTIDLPSKLAHLTGVIPQARSGLIMSHDEFGSESSVVSRTVLAEMHRDRVYGSDAVLRRHGQVQPPPENLSRPLLSCITASSSPHLSTSASRLKETKARSPCRRDLGLEGIPRWGQKQLLRVACTPYRTIVVRVCVRE